MQGTESVSTDPDVTVVIPYHAQRVQNGMLDRALWSLEHQTHPTYVMTVDGTGLGAAAARTAAIMASDLVTPWVAFLDSDDWMYPDHVETLVRGADHFKADYTYSYFTVHDAWEGARPDLDPLGLFGHKFDPEWPTQTTGTILVRTELARELEGFRAQPEDRMIPGTGLRYGEDYDFTVRAVEQGARIAHIPRRTWAWHIGHHNTSGLPGRGDAVSLRKDHNGH